MYLSLRRTNKIALAVLISLTGLFVQAETPMTKSNFGSYTDSLIEKGNKVLAFKTVTSFYQENPTPEMLRKAHEFCVKYDLVSSWASFLDSALSKTPYDSDLNYVRAQVHILQDESEQAENLAKLIYQTSAKKDLAFDLLYDIYAKKNESDKVVQILNQLVELNPAAPALYFERASFYLKMGQPKKAQVDLNTFNSKSKPTEKSYVLQSDIYAFEKQDFKIKENLKNCLGAFPESGFCFVNYLKAQPDKKNLYSIEHFEKNKGVFQNNGEVLALVGKQYEFANQPLKAEATYLALAGLDSSKFDDLKPLLSFYENTGKHNLSFSKVNDFISKYPKHEDAQAYIKNFLTSDKFKLTIFSDNSNKQPVANADVDAGKQAYDAKNFAYLVENKQLLDPKHPNYYYRLGNVYFQNKQINFAIQTWQKVKPEASSYESSQLNTVLAMGQYDFKTKSLQLLETKKFSSLSDEQIKTIKELIATPRTREPANSDYESKVVEPLTKYMNLGWE